jgi:hypothetical protein
MSDHGKEYIHSSVKKCSIIQELTERSSKAASTNPRGIPYAPFVDNVEDYVSSRGEVEPTLKSFQEMISYAYLPTCKQMQANASK